MQIGANKSFGEMASGLVLVQLSRFETRADNFGDARGLQAGDLIAADPLPLFQSEPRRFDRTGENGAAAVATGMGPNFTQPSPMWRAKICGARRRRSR